MNDKRLFLLDAYALIFRAYYALIKMPRITRSGFNTSAIFGFVNTLEELLRREDITHIAVCFDPPGPTFRHEAFEQYKGERESTPEDIKLSVPVIKEIIEAYRIPILEVAGYEADDVIGSMAIRAAEAGFTTYMMTPDKDFGQLVGPQVLQYKPAYRGQEFEVRGEKEVCGRYGLERTSQVIDLLALMGDKIDNIPGCPGVGEKTAVKLINEFGSVEALLADTSRLKGALRKKVEENSAQILLSKDLATIRTDVPLDVSPDDLVRREADRDRLFSIFKKLEFRSLAERVRRRIDGASASRPIPAQPSLFDDMPADEAPQASPADNAPAAKAIAPAAVEIVAEGEASDAMTRALAGADECGFLLLCPGDDDFNSPCLGAAVALADGRAWFVPASAREGMNAVLDIMARGDIRKICPDAKRDYVAAHSLRGDDDEPLTSYYDVGLAHYLLQPEMRHSLRDLTATYLRADLPDAPWAALPPRNRGAAIAAIPADSLAAYGTTAALAALKLRPVLEEELEKSGMAPLLHSLELPLLRVLAKMEIAGVRIDVESLNAAAHDMESKIAGIESRIFELAGEQFNVGSPTKVGEILFDKLDLEPKGKKTRAGKYSTSEDVLEKVMLKHPIVPLILEYRRLKKLLTTYLTALPAAINPSTGRIHTNYNQTVTATGRISSSNPNLQNIPVRNDVGREIRRAFIPDPGHLFLSADYSQIELRLVADFSDDETMLRAFAEGDDIHAITAAKIYHKPLDQVTADERRKAKTANFGILYGISAFGLSNRLGIPRAEAKELIDSYFATFPTIRKYISDSVEHARENGYVLTRMGRRRILPDINSKNPVVRGYAERNAVNAPIQGSAADIIKKAMVDIQARIEELGLKSKMIMQVHDELNFDVVPEELPAMQELVAGMMERAYSGRVRLTASAGVATNWLDAH